MNYHVQLFALIFMFSSLLIRTESFIKVNSFGKSSIMSVQSHMLLTKIKTPLKMSTVISPPKVGKTVKKGDILEPKIPQFLFKENRNVQKEFEDYIDENKFYVILVWNL